jgi:hypothetical protein
VRLSVAASGLAAAVLLGGVALADPPAPSDPTTVPGVTVTGTRASAEKVQSFVNELTATSPGVQMARWDRSICVGVLGLPEQHAQFMSDRIAANAVAVGLDTGKPGCRPNVLVMIAPDANAFTKQIVHAQPRAFGAGVGHNRGPRALKDFTDTPRPVRWWHVSQTKAVGGFEVSEPVNGGRGMDASKVEIWGGSRIRSNVVEVFGGILIVVDAKGAQGVSYQALCDYISMVALAQIDPKVDVTALPSVLTLFHNRDEGTSLPTGLTPWDLSYLKALYTVPADVDRATREKSEITEQMKKTAPAPSTPDSVSAPKPQ